MRISHKALQHKQWLRKPISAHGYQHWLVDNASLTLRLKQLHPKFRVKPVRVRYANALNDEHNMLHLKQSQNALVREVTLMSNNQALVFAHSVLPKRSLRGDWHGLSFLGSKPLGEALFANPKVKRTSFSFKKLPRHHALYQKAIQYSDVSTPHLWARRSVFSLNCVSILVTEIFLPNILQK